MLKIDPGSQVTVQLSGYIFTPQVEELCLREATCTCPRTHRKLDGKGARIWVWLPSSGLPGFCSIFPPILPLSQAIACLLAYSLGCVDKVSNQLGVGSVRSGEGRGSAGEGQKGR